MHTQEGTNWRKIAARNQAGQVAFSSLIAAGLMLFFGLSIYDTGEIRPEYWLYDLSAYSFVWVLRIGGFAMLFSAIVCWSGWRQALIIDALLAGLIGLMFVVIGLIWMVNSDIEGILLLIFGAMFIHSAKSSFDGYQMLGSGAAASGSSEFEAADEDIEYARPVDQQAKQQAVKRLLDTKAGKDSNTESKVQTEPPPPTPQTPPTKVPEPPDDEPPPDGFLAQLGQEDE